MAQQLVSVDGQGRFVVNPQALASLRALKGPIAVLSVCGRARQGKSWLLNQLANKLTGAACGFQVSGSQKPCTKGLWLWSKPIPRTGANGLKYNLLLMDAEGIDALDQTKDYAAQVFSLALLLSSTLVYNQMHSIDESNVETLSTACQYARRIKSQSGGATGSAAITQLSPSFLWLVRDFSLQLQGSANDYMEDVLNDVKGDKGKAEMRAAIRDVFPAATRTCHTLVRPLADERQLAAMDKVALSQLRPEFRQGLDHLVEALLARTVPKAVQGTYLTGPALASLAQAFVQVINKGELPNLPNTWQAVVLQETARASDEAFEAYCKRIEAPGLALDRLQQEHEAALAAAIAMLQEQAMGDMAGRTAACDKLQARAIARVRPLLEAREAAARAAATQMLTQGGAEVHRLLARDPVDCVAVENALHAVMERYEASAAGPSKYQDASNFALKIVIAMSDSLKRVQDAMASIRQESKLKKQEADQASHQATQLQAELQAGRTELQKQAVQLAGLQRDLEQSRRKAATASTDAYTAVRKLTAAEEQVEDERKSKLVVEQKLAEAERKLGVGGHQLSAAQTRAVTAEQRLAEAERKVGAGGQQLAAGEQQLAVALRRAVAAEQKLGVAERQLQASGQQLAEAQRRATEGEARVAKLEATFAPARQAPQAQYVPFGGYEGEVDMEDVEPAGAVVAAGSRKFVHVHRTGGPAAAVPPPPRTALPRPRSALPVKNAVPSPAAPPPRAAAAITRAAPPAKWAAPPVAKPRAKKQIEPGTESKEEVGSLTAKRARPTANEAAKRKRPATLPTVHTPSAAGADQIAGPPPGVSPFSQEREVLMSGGARRGARGGAAEESGGDGPSDIVLEAARREVEQRLNGREWTVAKIKDLLVRAGLEANVHALQQLKPAPKREQWVQLVAANHTRVQLPIQVE